jgi:hypothetical protein
VNPHSRVIAQRMTSEASSLKLKALRAVLADPVLGTEVRTITSRQKQNFNNASYHRILLAYLYNVSDSSKLVH